MLSMKSIFELVHDSLSKLHLKLKVMESEISTEEERIEAWELLEDIPRLSANLSTIEEAQETFKHQFLETDQLYEECYEVYLSNCFKISKFIS